MRKLLTIALIALSLCAKGQKKFTKDTLKVSQVWFSSKPYENAISMGFGVDSGIVITGDTIKCIRFAMKQVLDVDRRLQVARTLLNFYQVDLKSKNKAYLKALKEYWKLNNDNRYKLIK